MLKKEISLIIVHYNTYLLLKEQLNLLLFHLNKSNFKIEIIVVDNNSLNQEQKKVLKNSFDQVKFIFNKKNLGFGRGANCGVKKSQYQNLLILNPDILLNDNDLIKYFSQFEKSNLDAVSPQPKLANYQKPLPTFFSLLAEFTIFKKILSLKNFNSITLTGGCLLIKKNVFSKISGFDNDFFLWFEDSDLTKRLLDNKFKIGFLPINIRHLGGVSFEKMNNREKNKIFFSSLIIYSKKHLSIFSQILAYYLFWKFSKFKGS